MNPDEFCTSDSWSPLTAASSNSALAAVLGGFLITAIALLLPTVVSTAICYSVASTEQR